MSGASASARSLVLVGCGKMGTAMLRGWLRRDAAAGNSSRGRAEGRRPALTTVSGAVVLATLGAETCRPIVRPTPWCSRSSRR